MTCVTLLLHKTLDNMHWIAGLKQSWAEMYEAHQKLDRLLKETAVE